MNYTAVARMTWKEYRAVRAFWLALIVLTLFVQCLLIGVLDDSARRTVLICRNSRLDGQPDRHLEALFAPRGGRAQHEFAAQPLGDGRDDGETEAATVIGRCTALEAPRMLRCRLSR